MNAKEWEVARRDGCCSLVVEELVVAMTVREEEAIANVLVDVAAIATVLHLVDWGEMDRAVGQDKIVVDDVAEEGVRSRSLAAAAYSARWARCYVSCSVLRPCPLTD